LSEREICEILNAIARNLIIAPKFYEREIADLGKKAG
jgi:hypothetical protein